MNKTTGMRLNLYEEHWDDLRTSGINEATAQIHNIRSLPAQALRGLLGFDVFGARSGMLFPFPSPRGGFMEHVRLKVFPPLRSRTGNTIKYLQPQGSGLRLFFCLPTLPAVLNGTAPLWLVEGEKKALAVAQLGLAAVGFCGIEGWHVKKSSALIPDFNHLRLAGRLIELVPDGDWRTNPNVERGALRLAEALEMRGARVNLVVLPKEISA